MARKNILHVDKQTEQKNYRLFPRNVLLKKWQTFSPCFYRIISKTLFSFSNTTTRVAIAGQKYVNVFYFYNQIGIKSGQL